MWGGRGRGGGGLKEELDGAESDGEWLRSPHSNSHALTLSHTHARALLSLPSTPSPSPSPFLLPSLTGRLGAPALRSQRRPQVLHRGASGEGSQHRCSLKGRSHFPSPTHALTHTSTRTLSPHSRSHLLAHSITHESVCSPQLLPPSRSRFIHAPHPAH